MTKKFPHRALFIRCVLSLAFIAALSGCTTYHAVDLAEHADLIPSEQLALCTTNIDLTANGSYTVDPSDGFDLTEVSILAVLNNPDLKAERVRRNVADAQVFSAGLLPDPQLSAGLDNPLGAAAGLVTGWGVGVGYDLIPLITRHRRIEAAQHGSEQVDLELLWREWQTIQRARILFVRYASEEQQRKILERMLSLYKERYAHSAKALKQKIVTVDVNGTDLTALLDVQSKITQLLQTHNETRHQLNLLLGLAPHVNLEISTSPVLTFPDSDTIHNRLESLPQHRPDLLALQAGYQAQESRVRAAILAQFPSLSVGVNRAHGTDRVNTFGVGVNLNLPIFSGNRSEIAIERATRAKLHEEYNARLDHASTEVDQLIDLNDILGQELSVLREYLPKLFELMEHTRKAYGQGDIEALTFLNIELTWLNKRIEQIQAEQVQNETSIAIQTLLAMPYGFPEHSSITNSGNQ